MGHDKIFIYLLVQIREAAKLCYNPVRTLGPTALGGHANGLSGHRRTLIGLQSMNDPNKRLRKDLNLVT